MHPLLAHRKRLGMTQTALAERMRVNKVNNEVISKIEHGKIRPKPWVMCELANALDLPPEKLFPGSAELTEYFEALGAK